MIVDGYVARELGFTPPGHVWTYWFETVTQTWLQVPHPDSPRSIIDEPHSRGVMWRV